MREQLRALSRVGMDDSHGSTEIACVCGCQRVRVCAVLSIVGSDVPPRCGLAACDCPGTFTLGHGSTDRIRYKCMCVSYVSRHIRKLHFAVTTLYFFAGCL